MNELGRCVTDRLRARFTFNRYRLSALLILRRRGKSCYMLHSNEGVTQGDTPSTFPDDHQNPMLSDPLYIDGLGTTRIRVVTGAENGVTG